MVGITLSYAGLVGLSALDQHRTNVRQLSWPDVQNDIEITASVDLESTKLPIKMSALAQQMLAIWEVP